MAGDLNLKLSHVRRVQKELGLWRSRIVIQNINLGEVA